jgi:hypothetical protein
MRKKNFFRNQRNLQKKYLLFMARQVRGKSILYRTTLTVRREASWQPWKWAPVLFINCRYSTISPFIVSPGQITGMPGG